MGGVDSSFSMEPDEMRTLVIETEKAWRSLGKVKYGPTEKETASLVFRRSIYVVEDMKSGDTFNPDNLRIIRPGFGLLPKYYDLFLGREINRNIPRGTPVSWDFI